MKRHNSQFLSGVVVEMCGLIGWFITLATDQGLILTWIMVGFVWIGAGTMIFSGKVARYEWLLKYDRCPTCKQGWIKKESK